MDLMQAWFQAHLDVVFFVYGFAFIAMGLSVAFYIRIKSAFRISQPLWLLAVFGISHGINEWLKMFSFIRGGGLPIEIACFCALMISYLFLFEFGRQLNALHLSGAPGWLKRLEQRNGIWMTAALFIAMLAIAFSSNNMLLTGTVFARYLLGFPGAVLSAAGMWLYYRSEQDVLKTLGTKKYFYAGAAAFLFYGILAGLIVPPAPFFPADTVNTDAFAAVVHIPVQVFRALCAVAVAWSVTGILKLFRWERLREEQRSREEITILKQQIEFILGVTKTGLDIIDADYTVRYVDPEWKKVYGEYEGRKCHDYFMGRTDPCPKCGIAQALRTKKVAVSQESLPKEGNRPIEVTTIPFKDANGEWMVAEVNVDIAGRKKAEEQLRASEEKYRLIVENAQDPITIVDDTGTVLMLNMTAARHLRGVPADFTGKKLDELFPQPAAERMLNNIRRVIRSGVGELIENSMPFPGGARWFSTRVHPTTVSGSSRPCALTIARDMTDHKQAEQDVRKFKMIADNATYGVGMVDLQGKVIYANASFAEVHGYSVPELIGRDISVFHAPDQMAEVQRILRILLTEGSVSNVEVWHARRDGTTFPMLMNVVLVRDEKEQPLFIATTAMDITARKKAEEALRASEERFRYAMEATSDGLWDWNMVTGAVYYSPGYARLLGYASEALAQDVSTWTNSLHPEERDGVIAAAQRLLHDPGHYELEFRVRTLDGDYRWVLSRGKVVERGADGLPRRAVGTHVDITERKQAEELLRESEDRYRTLIENVGIGVALISPRMEVLTLNNQMKKWFPNIDVAQKPLCYKSFNAPPKDDVCSFCPTRRTLADGKTHEAVAETSNGDDMRTFRIVSTPLFNEKGKVRAAIEMVEDITERRTAEKKLELFRNLLDQSNDAIYIIEPETGRFLDVNGKSCSLLGYTREELLAMSVTDIEAVIPDPQAWKRHVEEVRSKGYVILEGKNIRKDKSIFPVDVNVKYIEQAGKAFMVAVVRDATERKRAEDELKDSEEKYRTLVETTDTGFLILDNRGRVLDANAEYVRLTGHRELKEILGRSVLEWTSSRMKQRNEEAVAKCIRERCVRSLEIEYIGPQGSIIPVEINATVQGEGASLRIISLCRDITGRKQAEEALKENERKTRGILDQSFGFIGLMTTDGILVEANRSALEFAGVEELDVLGKPFWETPWWTHSPGLQERLRRSVEKVARGEFDRFEATHTAADGTLHYVDFSLKPVKDESGKVVFMIPEARDVTERRQAEAELAETQLLFSTQFNLAGIGLAITSPEKAWMRVNRRLCDMLGYSEEELRKKTWAEMTYPADLEPDTKQFARLISGTIDGYHIDKRFIRRDGSVVYTHLSVTCVRNPDRTPKYFIASLEDITERKMMEEALRKSETKYHDLVDTARSIILMLDRDKKITFINKYGEEFFGYRLEEIAGNPVVGTIVPEKDSAGRNLRSLIGDVFNKPEAHLVQENENVKKNGERVWISWANRLLHDEAGKPAGFLSVGTDITARKRAEELIVRAARDWAVTFDSMADGVTLSSPDFDVVKANGAVCALLGKKKEEILGKKCFQVFHGRKTPIEGCPLHKAKTTRQKEYAEVFEPYLNKWLAISVSPVLDEAGRVTMLVHMVRDITTRRQAEEALRKAYADLQEMQNTLIQSEKLAALGRFSLGVAHEIKNPLGIILGGIEYLEIKMPDLHPELKETMKKVEDATVRADRIIHTLLRFARPADLKMEQIRPEDLISETIAFLKYRAPVSNIKIVKKFMKEKLFVNVDKNQIQQVLFNLLINAVEAMPPAGGEICIKTHKAVHKEFSDKPACVIEVVDAGTGISRDNLKRMFEPFFTTKRDKKGTGLGLPVSKTIINNHKGDIVIESEEGKGTTVRIILPIAEG